jgi:hypothetical protein
MTLGKEYDPFFFGEGGRKEEKMNLSILITRIIL